MFIKAVLIIAALSSSLLGKVAFADVIELTPAPLPLKERFIPPHYHSKQSNFLIGAEIGYARQHEKFITQFTAPFTFPQVTLFDHNEKINDKGMLFGALVGWQFRCDRMMLGVEANVDLQNFNTPRAFMFSDVDLPILPVLFSSTAYYDRGPIWALTGRIGYFVTPGFMPYLRLGAQLSEDEVNYQVFALSITGLEADFSSVKKTIYGVVAGLGAEFPTFIGGSTIRFEYVFSSTERIAIEDKALPIIGTHKFYPSQTNAFKMAWVWNFI